MKVLFLTFIPSPYRLAFFEELSKSCDLTVLFERAASRYRKGRWSSYSFSGYRGVILKGLTLHKQDRLCPGCIKYVTDRRYDIVVLSNPLSPTGFLAAAVMKMTGVPYMVECDGAFPAGSRGIRQRMKGYVFKSARLCLSTGRMNDEYLKECGVAGDRIRRYPFSSISEKEIISAPLTAEEKRMLREEIGMEDGFSVIYTGRIVGIKGIDTLLRVARKVRDCHFYVIGGKATGELADYCIENDLSNVTFLEFKPREEVLKWMCASDVFLMTTRWDPWGLVINEALACGLPVISTDMCLSAVEISAAAEVGFITDVDDSDSMAGHIARLKNDPALLYDMGRRSIEIAASYTIESMAAAHSDIFNGL